MGVLNDETKPYWLLIPVIIIIIGLMVWMNLHMPPADLAPYGYSSVIIAFEFALNQTDLYAVLSPLTPAQLNGLDMMNYIDFGYMIAYPTLLAGFFYITREMEGHQYLNIGMALAGCAMFSDLFENFQLLDLTEMYRASATMGYESVLSNLFIFTWLKWSALALAMVLLVPVLIQRGTFSKIIAVILSLPIIMLLAVAVVQTPSIMDKFSSSIVLGFLGLITYIIAYRKPQATIN